MTLFCLWNWSEYYKKTWFVTSCDTGVVCINTLIYYCLYSGHSLLRGKSILHPAEIESQWVYPGTGPEIFRIFQSSISDIYIYQWAILSIVTSLTNKRYYYVILVPLTVHEIN